MIYCIYNKASRALIDISEVPYPLDDALDVRVLFQEMPDLTKERWSPALLAFERKARTMSVLEFRNRFTPAEKVRIYTAAKASVEIQIWLDDLNSVKDKEVSLDDQRTIDGVHGLEQAGLLDSIGRAAEVLA